MKLFLIILFSIHSIVLIGQTKPTNTTPKPKLERDKDITQFKDKQEEMLKLISLHKLMLEKIEINLNVLTKSLSEWSETLKYPKKVAELRQEAFDSLTKIKKSTDQIFYQMKDIHYKWFVFESHMSAVYTRYGEMLALEKVDANLKLFLKEHRDHLDRMKKQFDAIDNINKEVDYLLFSKLNN